MIEASNDPSYERRLKHIVSHPNVVDEICAHVANGGTVLTLAESWAVRFSDVMRFIHASDDAEKRYMQALNDRAEWGKEAFLAEARRVGLVNVKDAFNEDGSLKPISEIPEDIMRCVSSMEIDEIWEGQGNDRAQIGVTKRLRLEPKLKAIELLMKNSGLLIDRHIVKEAKTLEDLLAESYQEEAPETDK